MMYRVVSCTCLICELHAVLPRQPGTMLGVDLLQHLSATAAPVQVQLPCTRAHASLRTPAEGCAALGDSPLSPEHSLARRPTNSLPSGRVVPLLLEWCRPTGTSAAVPSPFRRTGSATVFCVPLAQSLACPGAMVPRCCCSVAGSSCGCLTTADLGTSAAACPCWLGTVGASAPCLLSDLLAGGSGFTLTLLPS